MLLASSAGVDVGLLQQCVHRASFSCFICCVMCQCPSGGGGVTLDDITEERQHDLVILALRATLPYLDHDSNFPTTPIRLCASCYVQAGCNSSP
jgi:hypothetical protein